MTPTEFRERFVEFAADPPADELIAKRLAEAERVAADTMLNRDDYVALLAARALALDPFGRDSRLGEAKGGTVYDGRIREMVLANGVQQRSY